MIGTFLLIAADVIFFIGAFFGPPFGPPAPNAPFYGRLNLISLGLALWVLSVILGGAHWH